jgi:hypothetical protein
MALGSPAELIPFTRFLERRQHLHRIAGANGTVVIPESTDLGILPDVTGTANAGVPPPHESAPVHAATSSGGMGAVEAFGREAVGHLVVGGALEWSKRRWYASQ